MLNGGKTSLVATFLSEQGRKRTLRGANNDEGTHRFVLWLPEAWRSDDQLWGLLLSRIGDVVGSAPEMLADDPDEAHVQYNNSGMDHDALSIPLVATDPRLNEVGMGLLDCPDIVSDEAFGLGSPEMRRELLGKAATFCSAFIVVASAESSRDKTLGDLMRIASELMPGVPRMLAVNKVRPRQTPDQVLETFGPLARNHDINKVYAAYDFDVPGSKPYIPSVDDQPVQIATDVNADLLPVFFEVSPDADANPPAAIEDDRMMLALPSTLDRGQLFAKFSIALQTGLRTAVWDDGYQAIEQDANESKKNTETARQCLLNSALEFFANRAVGGEVTELRLHQSERIIRQLSDAFAATAPWYARWGVKLNAATKRIFGGATDFLKQLTPSAIAKRTAGEIKEKFRKGEIGGLISPERLQAAIDLYGGPFSLGHWFDENGKPRDESHWDEAAEAAINRFERDDFTLLDEKKLEEAVTQMWANVPMHKKITTGLTPLAASLAAFGGVLMVPIDLGGSLIASASIAELFAALGLSALSTYWAGGQNSRQVGQQAARQQLSDFQAVLCDTYGVSRPEQQQAVDVAGSKEKLPISQIPRRDPVGPTLSVFETRTEFTQELQRIIPHSRQSK